MRKVKFPKDIYQIERIHAPLTEETWHGEIYLVTDQSNGKQYCGQTTESAEERWETHCYDTMRGCDLYFHNALRAHGSEADFYLDCFTIVVIDVASSQDELDEKEIQWIAELDLMNRDKGYNRHRGGKGGPHHPETLLKIRQASLARWENMTEEERAEALLPLRDGWNEWWNALTTSEKLAAQIPRKKGWQEWWSGLTEEQKLEHNQTLVENGQAWRDSLTAEEWQEHINKLVSARREYVKNRTAEQTLIDVKHFIDWVQSPAGRKAQSDRAKRKWNSLSESEQEERMSNLTEAKNRWWSNLSKEDKQKHQHSVNCGKDPYDPKRDISGFFSEK